MSMLNLNLIYFAPCGMYEGVGGGARLKNMIDVFEQLGVNIQLISYVPKEEFKIKHEKTSDFLNTTTIYVPKSSPKFLKAFAIPLVFMYGLKYIRRSDIVFAHSPCITSGFPANVLAKIFNKPLIIDHMDVKDPDTPKFIFNSVLKNSTIVFAISHYLKKGSKNMGCKKVVYVPIFIDIHAFQRDVLERGKIRKELGIEEKDILVGYSGSFSHAMGVSFLLKAFRNLVKRYKNIKLILIGGRNTPDSDNIPLLIDELSLKEKVILIPLQPHDFIPKYLSACDIVCSPTINCDVNRAANPIKVYEYMSMSLPTVVSAVGEVSNVIENGVNGFLVKPGDIKDLERTLEWIILNPDRSKEIGENGRKKVMEKYSYDALRNTIKQSIEAIVYRKKGNKKRG